MIKKETVFFVVLLVFVFLYTFSIPRTIDVYDEGDYLYAAHDLTLGKIKVEENFYANRPGTAAPFALAMKFFGCEGIQLTYVTSAFFLILLLVVYVCIARYDSNVALLSVSLLGLSRIMIENAIVVMGDIFITLLANAIILLYFILYISKNPTIYKAKFSGIIAGVLFVAAILTKESIVFFIPLMCWLAYRDRNDIKKSFWKWTFAISAVGIFLICLWYFFSTGDFLYRLHAVSSGPSTSSYNYAYAPWQLIIKRITFQPVQFLIEDYTFGLLVLLSLLNLFRKSASKELSFFKSYLLFTLGMWWIAPQGLPWNPVALLHRLWLPLLVPLSVNASAALRDIILDNLPSKERKVSGVIVVIWLAITGFVLHESKLVHAHLHQPWQNFELLPWYYFTGIMLLVFILLKKEKIPFYLPNHQIIFSLIICSLIGYQGLSNIAALALQPQNLAENSKLWNNPKSDFSQVREAILFMEYRNPPCILADNNLAEKYHIYDNFKGQYPFRNWRLINADKIPPHAYLFVDKQRLANTKNQFEHGLTYTALSGADTLNPIPMFVDSPQVYGFVPVKRTVQCDIWEKL